MLINFSFGNFRSFRAVKSLRMEAVQIKELSDSIIERDGFRLLPTAVLYGANSSGKTNVIMALGLFRNIVDKNIKLNPGEDLVYDPSCLMIVQRTSRRPLKFSVCSRVLSIVMDSNTRRIRLLASGSMRRK